MRQYNGAPMPPAPLLLADRWFHISYWLTEQFDTPRLFSSQSPNYLSFTNRKRKYVEEKTTATLKIKQTSIATVRNHILTVAC